jgi:predicted AAA+ superfamily ATPase
MIRKEDLTKIIKDQREKILNKDIGTQREDIDEFRLRKGSALIISGIRRCGKSTLMHQLLKKNKDFYYLNLEDPRLEGFELKDFFNARNIFEEEYGKNGIYFFDEIQNINSWEKFVRGLVDEKKIIVITGSNASLLSRELGTKLTGRHINRELFPFSFNEYLKYFKFNHNKDSYKKYFIDGGFPEYLEEKDNYYLNEILNSVMMRDIAVRYGIKNTNLLKKMAIYLISNIAKEFSYNSLKKILEVSSVRTVIDYISYFEDSYLIFTIPKFTYSYKKQQVNPKKVYSIDNGFSNANSISFSKDLGKMLENQVFLHLRRKYKEIFYFQEKGECDFIVKDRDSVKECVQVCYEINDENEKREINGLIEALKETKLKTGLILTMDQEDELKMEGKSISIKPVWKWMLE